MSEEGKGVGPVGGAESEREMGRVFWALGGFFAWDRANFLIAF